MSSRPIRTETDQMRKCFEAYLAMGRSRDIKIAAAKAGVAVRTAQNYRECLKWEERITKYMATYNEFPPSALALIWSLNTANPLGFDALGIPHDLNVDNTYATFSSSLSATSPEDVAKAIPNSACIPVIKGEIPPQDLKNIMDNEIIQANMDGTGIMTKKEYRLLLGTMIREFANRFRLGDVRINTIYEFEKIVKLDMLLMGEATNRNNVNINSSGDPLVNNEINITVEQTMKDPKVQLLIADLWRSYNSPDIKDQPNKISDLLSEGMNRLGEMVSPSTSTQPIPVLNEVPTDIPVGVPINISTDIPTDIPIATPTLIPEVHTSRQPFEPFSLDEALDVLDKHKYNGGDCISDKRDSQTGNNSNGGTE